jgi:SAM-dependent methyltransferase
MDKELYNKHYEAERKVWWFIGRRYLISKNIFRIWKSGSKPKILDFGCGTGGMLDELKDVAETYGCDTEQLAVEFCQKRGLKNITKLENNNIPYENNFFDVITAMDVLEHIDDDKRAMSELKRILKSSGKLLITVPAFMFLWTTRDERLHHFRRYTKNELKSKLSSSGFKINKCSYMHSFYFLPLLLIYKIKKLFGKKDNAADIKTDFSYVPGPVNKILTGMLILEAFWLKYLNMPFGVSLFCIAEKEQ